MGIEGRVCVAKLTLTIASDSESTFTFKNKLISQHLKSSFFLWNFFITLIFLLGEMGKGNFSYS